MARRRLSEDALQYFREQGARGGRIGGKKLAAMMTPAERKARAVKASQAAAVARSKKKNARAKSQPD